jgi:hypothetical protein
MPTKNQAKTAIDNAGTAAKSDIDTILPVGVNITDGSISFVPTKYVIHVNTGGNISDAVTMATTISANLTAASRPNTIVYQRRTDDGRKAILVSEQSLTVVITGF